MGKISLNDIFETGVVTGVDMVNGYMPLVVFANGYLTIEVANCDREQGDSHRNMDGDEWFFQYQGSRTIESEVEPVTIDEGEMSVIPRGVSHKNVGHGSNIKITIYTHNPLEQLSPSDPEQVCLRMKMKNGKPVIKSSNPTIPNLIKSSL